jgi:hypothetical protein
MMEEQKDKEKKEKEGVGKGVTCLIHWRQGCGGRENRIKGRRIIKK